MKNPKNSVFSTVFAQTPRFLAERHKIIFVKTSFDKAGVQCFHLMRYFFFAGKLSTLEVSVGTVNMFLLFWIFLESKV